MSMDREYMELCNFLVRLAEDEELATQQWASGFVRDFAIAARHQAAAGVLWRAIWLHLFPDSLEDPSESGNRRKAIRDELARRFEEVVVR